MNDQMMALRALVDLRDRTLQKSRIAFTNRLSAIERGTDQAETETEELLTRWEERFIELEKAADKDIAVLGGDLLIVQHMIEVKGVGPMLAAKVASMIDIERSETVSQLWRFAGYAVIDGERERPTKGKKLTYNKRLKTACYLTAVSMMRANSPYRAIYDEAREHYARTHADWTDMHQHLAALRKMTKVWLSHVWERWRKLEGLPTRKAYVIEKLGHTTVIEPTEYGWSELATTRE